MKHKLKNFQLQMWDILNTFETDYQKPTLLLHSCCAPCSSSVLELLESFFNITVFYFNPCIFPECEFEKRKVVQKEFIEKLNSLGKNIKLLETSNCHEKFLKEISGFETCPEGAERCNICIRERLEETAKVAALNNFNFFCSTLSVSPHKNCETINKCGLELEKQFSVKFLPNDFKKNNGFLKSTTIAKQENLYRQDYCGCEFSMRNKKIKS